MLIYLLTLVCISSFSFKLSLKPSLSAKSSFLHSDFHFPSTIHSQYTSLLILNANPITSEGSNYGKYTNEEDAFLWFDEALFYVRAGSGGAGR